MAYTLFISTTAILYSSLLNLLPHNIFYKIYLPANLLFLFLLFLLNRDLTPRAMGIQSDNLVNSLLLGLVIGILVLIPIILFVRLRHITIQDPRLAELSSSLMLLYALFIRIFIGTAVFEEIVHRGIILARFSELTSLFYAVIFSSLVFVAWHIFPTIRLFWSTIIANVNSSFLQYSLFFASFLVFFIGGLVFSWIRLYTGNIAGAILAHWIINAGTLLAFYLTRKS